MAVSIILAHPTPGSFNHAIAAATAQSLAPDGYRVHLHDLFAEGFDCRFAFADFSTPLRNCGGISRRWPSPRDS